MSADPEPPWDRALGVRLRPYQQEVVARFGAGLEAGERRFHFVAPPGSGKTVTGIALALETPRRAVVLSPNAAIQAQWAHRFEDVTAPVPHAPSAQALRCGIGPDDAAPMRSLTYQSLTTKARGREDLSANTRALHDALVAEGVSLVILDECHHLTGHWGRTLRDLLDRLEDPVVVGFTATPPVDSVGESRATYLDLVGPISHQVPLPAVVKEGNLAPYQDLVLFTRPEAGELEALLAGDRELAALLEALEDLEPPLVAPSLWCERVLERCEPGGQVTPMDEWLRAAPDQVIAYVRYVRARHLDVPASVLWLDEMESDLEVGDLAQVLGDWLEQHLLAQGEERPELASRIEAALRELGFVRARRGFRAANVGAARKLLSSRTKLEGMRRVLRAEAAAMLDDLRALVLTDYELGRKDEECLTAIDVMALLTSDEELDELDPILVTGRSVLVDDDLLPAFEGFAASWLADRGLEVALSHEVEAGYVRVTGAGGDWGTTTYVALITAMLDQGLTRCLVGTRALLGEGWDSLTLNTLVDLTAVAGFVSVNQIRGRTIRKDPMAPLKCANNWDVVTVVPGAGFGLYDLVRLERKHSHLYGISDDGVVEKGLGHVHPWLVAGAHGDLGARLDDLNQDMLGRARRRDEAYGRWGVGEPYQGRDGDCLELRPPPGGEGGGAGTGMESCLPVLWQAQEVRVFEEQAATRSGELLRLWFLLLPLMLWLVHRLRTGRARQKLLAAPPREEAPEATVHRYARAVLDGLRAGGLLTRTYPWDAIRLLPRAGGTLRVVLHEAEEADAEVFTGALFELLGPVQDHRYLIERRVPELGPEELLRAISEGREPGTRIESMHPVPSVLGAKRELADAFREAWNQHVGPGDVVYTRRGEGKELAARWFRRRVGTLRRARKEVWW